MTAEINQPFPAAYNQIKEATAASGFTMASDLLTCSLLRTIAASKPASKFLELGTGTGLSTAWILDGMDSASTLISIDNDPVFMAIAQQFLSKDDRLQLHLVDGGTWVSDNHDQKFDYIFADTWHGKYLVLDEVLSMLNKGGFYVIDDMLPQTNWPEGHLEKSIDLIKYLETRPDLFLTKQLWATGVIVAVKK